MAEAAQQTMQLPHQPENTPEARVMSRIRTARHEAEQAKRVRMRRNRRNLDAYFGYQDYSFKQQGQSQEFLPKTSTAVEQFASFVKRALVDFGDWFSMDIPEIPGLKAEDVRAFVRDQINTLSYASEEILDFATLLSDALKSGALESLMIFKIHGRVFNEASFTVERGITLVETPFGTVPQMEDELVRTEVARWKLCIDMISPTDYYPDPRMQRNLYEIHRCERDLEEIQAMAQGEDAIYDPAVVAQIDGSMRLPEDQRRREQHRGQQETPYPTDRRPVVIEEYWGTFLNDDGSVAESNVVATMANDRYLIRPPEPNPFWHGQSPFVRAPLIRVPFSTWHKALMDDAVGMNLSMNELYNLMLDGGMESVWGTKQLKKDWLDKPEQVEGGIPSGTTLFIKEEVPVGAKVLETVTSGHVPQDAMAMFAVNQEEFNASALTTDLRLGVLPSKTVKATEIVEAQQGQAGTIDGIVRDVEDRAIEPVLRKTWLTILQHFDEYNARDVINSMGERAAFILARMSPAQRFSAFADSKFHVNGLSATLARMRDFQKMLALMEAVKDNPLLAVPFIRKYSGEKILERFFVSLNIDTESIEKTPEERQQDQLVQAQAVQQQGPGGQPGGPGQSPTQLDLQLPGMGETPELSPQPTAGQGLAL